MTILLGQNKITDFSGDTGSGLNYRDYKDAFTNSCLIDTRQFKDNGRPRDVNAMESSRSNISYQMSEQDQKIYASTIKRKKQKNKEYRDYKNMKIKAFNTYDKIHQRLLNR